MFSILEGVDPQGGYIRGLPYLNAYNNVFKSDNIFIAKVSEYIN